ncbi:PD-(D/E)XK nuclease family protein [Erysipelothrix sp. D19-032]
MSYHASSYEGKGIEVSYPIERFCLDRNIQLEPWTLKQISERTPALRSLSPDLAPQIYLKDGKIVGSISAFQMYINNPYQFFVERGLALREPEKFTFDPRVIGTINHRIMETMHKQLPNDAWDTIGRVFPQNSNRIKMIQQA